jgi:hypothetical protein
VSGSLKQVISRRLDGSLIDWKQNENSRFF